MVLSEAQTVWGREIGKLEQLTGKRVTTLQDGIDAVKSRVEEITAQEKLSDKDLDVIRCLEFWADAITTLILAARKHQEYLKKEVARRTTVINGMWDRLK